MQKYDNDKLTIHITGSYRVNPTSIQSIDTTYVYQKYYPNYTNKHFLEPSLNGRFIMKKMKTENILLSLK